MAACYQLVLDRQIRSVCLSDQWHFIAVDTLASAKGMRCSTPYSLCNRFVHFNTGPDHTDWCSEILGHWIVPELIAFRCFADGKLLPGEKLQESDANPWAALSYFWAILSVLAKWLSLGGVSADNTQWVVFTQVLTEIAGESAGHWHLYRTVPESDSILSESSQQSHRMTSANRLPRFRIGSLSRLSPVHAAEWLRTQQCCLRYQVIAGTAMGLVMSFHTGRFFSRQDGFRCGTSASQSPAKGVMRKERREGQND